MGETDKIKRLPLIIKQTELQPQRFTGAEGVIVREEGYSDDYIPSEHQEAVEDATQAIHTCLAAIVQNSFEVGRQLERVKDILPHGRFHEWVSQEFGFSESMALRYMRVYRRLNPKAHILRQLPKTALFHLAAPSAPDKAITIVEEMIRAKKELSVQDVVDIIEECKRPALPMNEELATVSRLEKALRRAANCLGSQTVQDCEWVLGQDETDLLDGIRSDLETLRSRVKESTKSEGQSVATVSATEWTVDPEPVQPALEQPEIDTASVPQLADTQKDQNLDGRNLSDDTIISGCTVDVRVGDSDQEERYTIVADEPSDPNEGRINVDTPWAKALIGHRVGETTVARTPNGPVQLAITGIDFPDGRHDGGGKDTPAENRHAVDTTPRPAKSALTAATGFLEGLSHTLNPYTGCLFACKACYVMESPVHRFHKPRLAWGSYAHPRHGIAELLEKELARITAKGALDELAIFMSSATDPYQGLERRCRLSRACLEVFQRYPPGLLFVQTRSPFVQDDFSLLQSLGERCWLNVSLETDRQEVREVVTPRSPSMAKRLSTLAAALDAGLNVQITVSPCLPFSDVDTFGSLLLRHSQRVIVDTFTSGDGASGKRTAKTEIPALYTAQGWGDWRAETAASKLFAWLQQRIGDRAGWSQAGFTALAKQLLRGK